MANILVTRIIPEEGLNILRKQGYNLTVYSKQEPLAASELINMMQGQDALYSVGPNKINEEFLKACPNVKAIALMSVGYDNVDIPAAVKYGIPVSNTPDVLSDATSDIAFLLMLNVSRNAFYMYKIIERGEWGFYNPTANLGVELYGKTLGIFGLGRIGLALARKAKAAYGMPIIYHNRKLNEEAEAELGAKYVSFEELLKQSDVLSVHAGLSAQTKNIFNAPTFAAMKSSAIFINTARGGLHNEADLIAALQNKQIWGAGLDVTNPEPMAVDNPLLFMPNVCVLPHIGSATVETRNKMAVMAAENLVAALSGKQMPNVIDPAVYAKG